ncbi:putative butyrate kinase [Synergistales bacterium]|nr:putative butyrate kinase [Synergistales bacterium]
MAYSILTVNPGSTSTKVALFSDETPVWGEVIRHPTEELSRFAAIAEQFDFRLSTIKECIAKHDSVEFDAVVGRGGIIDPLPGGTFQVDNLLIERLKMGKPWEHASNLGGHLARGLAGDSVPAFIVDPVCVDELIPEARLMGLPELPKPSFSHALNIKATVRLASRALRKPWDELSVVVAHMGGGVSVVAHKDGRIIDTSNGTDSGPFSPSRSGEVPVGDVARACFSGQYTEKELKRKLASNGGLLAYLGTSDVRGVKEKINKGGEEGKYAALIYRSMAWQIAKEIGAQAVSLNFGDGPDRSDRRDAGHIDIKQGVTRNIDAILLTGGIAYDSEFVIMIQNRVQWITRVLVYPGEDEMLALAQGGLRVLRGEETAKRYGDYAPKK